MAISNLTNSYAYSQFFEPVSVLLGLCRNRHACPELPDARWIELGVCRSLLDPMSGRGFLQQYSPFFETMPSTGLFFEALKSRRRLGLCQELGALLCDKLRSTLPDPLAAFEELKNFDVHAGDGHWHGAAAHDPRRDGRKWPVGHLYTLNLRCHAMNHMEMADEEDRKHEHDMRALKRQSLEALRQGAPKGRKVLIAWDSACIDFEQWEHWKKRGGVYFLTRAKSNMACAVLKDLSVDSGNPVNGGVFEDCLVKSASGITLRRIRCEDPATGQVHTILTNERSLPPGLLAQIYRMRWDVEKVFDQFKNSLKEQKAWASSATAKTMQAHFLCLTHNLMLLMEHHFENTCKVTNTAEKARREKRFLELKEASAKAGRKVSSVYEHVKRFTKRSLKFIRCLRTHLFLEKPLAEVAAYLANLYQHL
jgi:hypothetical protein